VTTGRARVRHPLLLAIVVLLASTLFTLFVLEAGLRVAFARSTDFSMEMWKYAVQLKQPVDDSDVAFVHVPNGHAFLMGVDVRTNAHGMRDVDVDVKKAEGVYRILVLGDSTTFGWGVSLESTIPKLLEAELNSSSGKMIGATADRSASSVSNEGSHSGATPNGAPTRFEVLNAGVGNYNTVQEVASYQSQGRRFHPDLVILVYFINDAEPVAREKDGFLLRRSYTSAFVASRFDSLLRFIGTRPEWKDYYRSLYDEQRPGWIATVRALRSLARTTREENVPLVVAMLPELREINAEYPFKAQHEQVERVLASEGVPFIELIDGLKNHGPEESLFVTPKDSHPNRKANSLVAAQLRAWIDERGVANPNASGRRRSSPLGRPPDRRRRSLGHLRRSRQRCCCVSIALSGLTSCRSPACLTPGGWKVWRQ
jgi:lysophospholipase L1-like esterase